MPSADMEQLLIVPTCQHAVMDLVQVGEPIEQEKDKLLEQVGVRWMAVGGGTLAGFR